jgi:hypothetical protein
LCIKGSFGKEEWSKTEVVGKMMCIPNFIVNEIGVHSPTTSPYGYSSFPKRVKILPTFSHLHCRYYRFFSQPQ